MEGLIFFYYLLRRLKWMNKNGEKEMYLIVFKEGIRIGWDV